MPVKPGTPRTAWGRAFEGAFEAAISVVLAMGGGYYADRWLETDHWFLFLGLIVGGIAAVRRLLQIDPGGAAGMHATDDPGPPGDARPGDSAGSSDAGSDGQRERSGPGSGRGVGGSE